MLFKRKNIIFLIVMVVAILITTLLCFRNSSAGIHLTDDDYNEIETLVEEFTVLNFGNPEYTEEIYIKSSDFNQEETEFRLKSMKEYPLEGYEYSYLKRNFAVFKVRYYCRYSDNAIMRDSDMAYIIYLIRNPADNCWEIYDYMTPWDE